MTVRPKFLALLLAVPFAVACSSAEEGTTQDETDTGTALDTGTAVDSSVGVDTGMMVEDTGTVVTDTGMVATDTGMVATDTGMVATDTGIKVDTGTAVVDTGTAVVDTGTAVVDTGTVVVDTGTAVDSAAADTTVADTSVAIDSSVGDTSGVDVIISESSVTDAGTVAEAGTTCTTQAQCATTTSYCDTATSKCIYPTSCAQLHTANPAAPSGVYTINPGGGSTGPFNALCDMTTESGGWTLVLKANGSNSTFTYTASYWTNAKLLNEGSLVVDTTTEAKLESYLWVPFAATLVQMNDGGVTKSQILYVGGTSMLGRMSSTYQVTTLGRTGWRSLMTNPSLQPYCNKEGFNVLADPGWGTPGFPGSPSDIPELARVRIGILGNNENDDCYSPDSFVGIGGRSNVCGADSSISVGNTGGSCGTSLPTVNRASWGYVWVR